MLTTPLRPASNDSDAVADFAPLPPRSFHTGAVRRRRVLAILVAAFTLTVGLGVAGYRAAWWAAVAVVVVAATYRALLAQVRRTTARREWDLPAVGDDAGWEGWQGGVVDRSVMIPAPATSSTNMDVWALTRFAVGYLAAWVLTPVVAIAEQVAGGARADSRRLRWLEHLQRMQRYGRQQSVTALKVSMVATAGVGSFATLGLSAGAASAAPLTSLAASATTHYTVAVGDTLSAIAQRFGTTVSALASANDIADPNLIFVGQELVISGSGSGLSSGSGAVSSPTPAHTVSSTTYTVAAGDTLGAIAARFGTTVSALASANGIADPNLILVGQVLHIEGSASSTPAPSAPTSAPVATQPTASAPSSGSRQSYTVVSGDTLGSIAARFGTTVSALASANGIANPNLIVVGQVLVVSGGSAPVAATPVATTPATAAPTASPTPAVSGAAATAVRVALAQVGKPYEWGGAGPSSFDCSGLVMYAYAAAGVSLDHYTVSQYDETTPISESELEPGDLVFYDTGDGAQPGHVTMYIGGGQVVSANSPGSNVQTQSIGYDGTIMGFRRVVN